MIGNFHIGKPWHKDYLSLLSYATSQGLSLPTRGVNSVQWKQNRLWKDFTDAGLWTDTEMLHILGNGGVSSFARLNWKDKTSHLLTINGTVNWSSAGASSDGSTGYLDPDWAPSEGVLFTQNDAAFAVGIQSNVLGNTAAIGSEDNADTQRRVYLVPRSMTNQVGFAVNTNGLASGSINSDSTGRYYGERTSSSASSVYKNNTSIFNNNGTSQTRSTKKIAYLAFRNYLGNVTFHYTGIVSYVWIGKALDSTKRSALDSIMSTYVSGL
jgi:hypothetical protein